MPLNSKQIITTEDLQTYSVCGYNPLVSYVVGNNVKDPITGDIYKCTTNAPAGTLLSDPAYYTPVTSTPLLAATDAQALAMASSAIAVTPANLAALRASSVESAAKTITNKFINPADLAGMNSLALASDTYNASTNSPTLASMKDGDIYKVSTEGIQTIGGVSSFCAVGDLIAKANGATFFMSVNPVSYNAANGQTAGGLTVSFTQLSQLGRIVNITTSGSVTGAIAGAVVGAGSYLIAGDQVQYSSNGLSLVNLEIEPNTTINYGTGSSFGTLGLLNTYINKRSYISLTLNQLSATTETASVDVSNDCDGALSILGNGLTIDFSATANTNCTLSGNNIYIDDFKVKANAYIGGVITSGVLEIHGEVTHDNEVSVQNIHANGSALILATGGKFTGLSVNGSPATTANITLTCSVNTNYASLANVGAYFSAHNVTTVGNFHGGNSCSNYIGGAITTGGGQFNGGGSCSNYIGGAINTGGGQFNAGYGSCSNFFNGAITTGGGQFIGGNSCSNYIGGVLTTGGGMFSGGSSCSNTIDGAITTGGGQFFGGNSCSNTIDGAITTGGGVFYAGNSCSNYIGGVLTTGGGVFHAGDNCQTFVNNTITGVGAVFTFVGGTKLYVAGAISGYTIAGVQYGIGVYAAATSAGVLRNQNTNSLQAN